MAEISQEQRLFERLYRLPTLDQQAMEQARAHQQQLTKPAGSLGRLEDLAIQLAGIQGTALPTIEQKAVVVMAADHGVTAEGVSAFPFEVTQQMVLNFLHQGAAINVLARLANARVIVVDMGVAGDLPPHPELISRKITPGTANIAKGPAMTRAHALGAIQAGIEIGDALIEQGVRLIATGEMGIGNTTSSSALTAVLIGTPVARITGRGTGLNDQQLQHKISVIEQAIAMKKPDRNDPLDVLRKVGGLEIAGLVGVIIAAATRRVPVLIDGFISSAAALVAVALKPELKAFLVGSHSSVEPGHQTILQHLEIMPLLNLQLRLGEGSGAALAMPILEAATRIQGEMTTFEQAAVSQKQAE